MAGLVGAEVEPVTSCLGHHGGATTGAMKQAILKMVVSGAAASREEVRRYDECTLLAAQLRNERQQGRMANPEQQRSFAIHQRASAELNSTTVEQVADEQRQQAKQTVYGMVYGMSERVLAVPTPVRVEVGATWGSLRTFQLSWLWQ